MKLIAQASLSARYFAQISLRDAALLSGSEVSLTVVQGGFAVYQAVLFNGHLGVCLGLDSGD